MPRTFHVFHQNLMVFGGGAQARNAMFTKGFNAITLGTATDYVLAAGFTEVSNAATATTALGSLVVSLDPALQGVDAVAVGISGGGKIEYITMATFDEDADNRFVVTHRGKVVAIQDGGLRWHCFPVGDPLAANELPRNVKRDARGVAYLVGTIASAAAPEWHGKTLVVAFMHNMFSTGDSYGGMTRLPDTMKLIYDRHGLGAGTACVLGGDFNVVPRDLKAARSGFPMKHYCAKENGANVKTTLSNPYDYFYGPPGVGVKVTVWPQTRGKGTGLSDHAGVSLQLNPAGL